MFNFIQKPQSGILLPTAAVFSVVGMLTTFSYMSYALNKKINLDHRIATTKALYNAESGLAKSYQWLSSSDWESDYDSTTFEGVFNINSNMGSYKDVILYKSINTTTKRIERTSQATGTAIVKNIWGNSEILEAQAEMKFALESLAEYMYLSNHEVGGGAPGIFRNNQRTQPCFGSSDVMGNTAEIAGQLQTMQPMRVCPFGSPPQFNNTIFVTQADESYATNIEDNLCGDSEGENIFPFQGDDGACSGGNRVDDCSSGMLNGESGPDDHPCWESRSKVCFPLDGYFSTVGAASAEHTYDATEMLYLSKSGSDQTTTKDTLIMTDIEFLENGGYLVKRWWYLLPPYLKSDIMDCGGYPALDGQSASTIDCPYYGDIFNFSSPGNNQTNDGKNDLMYPQPFHLEGVPLQNPNSPAQVCDDYNNYEGDIRTCDPYTQALADFHTIELSNPLNLSDESFIKVGWQSSNNPFNGYNQNPGGGVLRFSHYDIENIPRYYDDRDDDWQEPANLPVNDAYWDTPYSEGGHLIENEYKYSSDDTVIHIKGGPVRVHGVYNGRYTVVTSGFDSVNGDPNSIYDGWNTYKRHAWNLDHGPIPIDTVRSNIWITDDLINNDSSVSHCPSYTGGPCPPQPSISTTEEDGLCESWEYDEPGTCGSSKNVLGLVSSSNVIIANSPGNRNNGVDIHASILALNESFVMHFWQNSVPAYQNAPRSDGRGVDLYGVDVTDERGYVRLWGGIIQEYRGYMMRGGPNYPYDQDDMGMDKRYNYDNNLFFPPPFYPYRNDCPVDGYNVVSMSLVEYGPIKN